ncbi:MAG TPA: ABC transporter ATP-binding protein, partial [Spirochaetia bacterium]|nr:ABC transporter ATP-binding protein [Spirochaetia bacterium]
MITLRNLSFSHLDSPPLFRSIDLEVARGERVLLIGRSGAGKSTLLAIIAGLVPDYVPGELSGSVERESDAIGIVFQNPEAQMVAPSVIEELAFALENRGVARGEMRSRIAGVASRFGLSNFLARAPAELSGGERQKVALASAITLRPEILLLDEPTSYLDPKATREFFELLELLPPETTVVMVEHKIDEALRHATRVIELTGSGELTEIPFPEGFDRAAYLPWRLKRLAETRTSGSYAEGAADGNVGSGADGPMNRPALVRTVGLHHSYDDGQAALL